MKRKAGRPPKPEGQARETPLTVRVTEAEKASFGKAAKEAKMSVSDWVRSALLAALAKGKK